MTKPKTASELLAELAADKEYVEMRAAKDAQLRKEGAELAAAERPIVEALKSVGINVVSVWDLVNSTEPYPKAIPILFEHLQGAYPEKIVEGIVRSLAIPESRLRWGELLDFLEKVPSGKAGSLRWAVACALDATADDDLISEVIRIVSDASYGTVRIALLPSLVRSRDARAGILLDKWGGDPVLGGEIQRLRRK